jgi:hypothetical protein
MTTVADIAAASSVAGQCAELSTLQVAAGYVTWMGVAKILAILVGGGCFAYLFGRFVLDMLRLFARVPFVLYEVLGFAGSAALVTAPALLGVTGHDVTWLLVPGVILFAATIVLSAKVRKRPANDARLFGLLTIVYVAAALWYANPVAGFWAVATFMTFTGFTIIVMPLSYALGFEDEKRATRAGGGGLIICLILVGERLSGHSVPQLDVFRTGMEWLGPFVFALAVLINTSRWSLDLRKDSYILRQIVAVVAYSAMIWAGSTYHIDALLNVGTGMLILWLLEKPFEVRYESAPAVAAVGLFVSLVVGGTVYWAQHHMDSVIVWLPAFAS